MLKIQSDRVIIDGHEPTKEQCETMTLLANTLAKSDKFKTVKYESGYAEFEKVVKADELKFAPGGGKNLSINFDEGIEKVVYLYNYIELTDNATLPGNAIFYEYTVSDSSQQVAINDGGADSATCGIAIYFKNGYTLNTLNVEYLGPYTGIKKNDGTALDAPVYGFTNSVNNSLTAIIITSKLATPRKSIDLTTLPGWSALSSGSHSITIVAKAEGYRDSEPSATVSVEKAAEEGYKVTFKKGDYSEADYYSTDNGVTWISCHDKFGTGVQFIVMAKQIKLKVQGDGSIAGQMSAKIDSTGANILSLLISCTSTDSDISSNYILTENITVTASGYWD